MTRQVTHHLQGPLPIAKSTFPGDSIYACQCGLSARFPLCDGSHKATLEEQAGQTYRYDRQDGKLVRLEAAEAS